MSRYVEKSVNEIVVNYESLNGNTDIEVIRKLIVDVVQAHRSIWIYTYKCGVKGGKNDLNQLENILESISCPEILGEMPHIIFNINSPNILKILLTNGADVNALRSNLKFVIIETSDWRERPALSFVENPAVAKLLIKYGADVGANISGKSIIMCLLEEVRIEITVSDPWEFGCGPFLATILRQGEGAGGASYYPLLVKLDFPVEYKGEECQYFVARAHDAKQSLDVILEEKVVGCNLIKIQEESIEQDNPFDTSAWRGGCALLADIEIVESSKGL